MPQEGQKKKKKYYLSFWRPGLQHNITGFYASGPLKRLQARCLLDLGSHPKGLWLFQDLVPCWLLAGSCPQFPAMWGLQRAAHNAAAGFLKASEREDPWIPHKLASSIIYHRSLYLCHSPCVEASHRSCTLTQKGLDSGTTPRRWALLGHRTACPQQLGHHAACPQHPYGYMNCLNSD